MKRYRSYSPIEKALIAQLYHLKSNTRKVINSDNPDILHDLRGAVLRIDFAIKYFNKWLQADKKMIKMVKMIRQKMAKVRSLDILSYHLDQKSIKDSYEEQSSIKKMIKERHDLSRESLLQVLKSEDYKNMLEELELLIGYSKLPHVFPGLKKILKKVIQWKKNDVDPKCLHLLRLAFKELRYSCEFIQNHELLDKITEFQNILGKRQDAITNIKLLKKLSVESKFKVNLCSHEEKVVKKEERKFYKKWDDTSLNDLVKLAPK